MYGDCSCQAHHLDQYYKVPNQLSDKKTQPKVFKAGRLTLIRLCPACVTFSVKTVFLEHYLCNLARVPGVQNNQNNIVLLEF